MFPPASRHTECESRAGTTADSRKKEENMRDRAEQADREFWELIGDEVDEAG